MARASFVAILLLLVTPSAPAQLPYTQEQVIAYAKSIDVHTLDASLPSQHLEDWLDSGAPNAHIWYWIVADTCDLKPADPNEVDPLCAKVSFGRNDEYGEFLVQVGNSREGIIGKPKLYYGVGVYERVGVVTGGSERLSDLPSLLDQPAVAGGVQKLYSDIVAHHPIGIPVGPEIASIRPYLSKRLAEQI
ncbi:MAG TPA: hypothetical protein VJT08_05790, partial [Terriglobales bacterium]|nr:hypothetical protein [Terriglobales bacterium]